MHLVCHTIHFNVINSIYNALGCINLCGKVGLTSITLNIMIYITATFYTSSMYSKTVPDFQNTIIGMKMISGETLVVI